VATARPEGRVMGAAEPAGTGRCLEENETFTRDVGAGGGARRRDLPLERLEALLAAHDEALARGDERVAKRARKADVTRHGDAVVKENVPLGWWGRLRDRLAPRRHAAGYSNAWRLETLGVATARPLAWVRRRGRVFAVYEDLSGLERIDLVARALYADGPRAAQARLRDASADWLGGLHARGIYHGDLKGPNVLVRTDGERFEFPLIDTDRVRFFSAPVDARRRVKNLAQLAASIARTVTRAERLRWYRRYAAAAPLPRPERDVARAVAAAVALRIAVVDEPIE